MGKKIGDSPPLVRIDFRLPEPMLRELDELYKYRYASRNEALREAVRLLLQKLRQELIAVEAIA